MQAKKDKTKQDKARQTKQDKKLKRRPIGRGRLGERGREKGGEGSGTETERFHSEKMWKEKWKVLISIRRRIIKRKHKLEIIYNLFFFCPTYLFRHFEQDHTKLSRRLACLNCTHEGGTKKQN